MPAHRRIATGLRFLGRLVLLGGLAGCAPDGGSSEEPPPLTVVEEAPAPLGTPPETRTIDAYEGDLRALGAQGSSSVLGTTAGAFAVEEGGLLALDIYGDDPDLPTSTGEVRAMARRTETLVLAAETGLYLVKGNKLQRSPASAALAELAISELHVTGAGDTERFWIVAGGAVYLLAGGELGEISIEGHADEAIAISPSAAGTSVLVAYPDGVHEVDLEKGEARELPHDVGEVRAMARGGEKVVYFASDRGLFVRGEDGAYTQFTLSGSGEPVAVDTVLVDPEGPIAVTGAAVVRLPADGAPAIVAELAEATERRRAAADDVGLVWVGGGGRVEGFLLGKPAGFEADVAPVLGEYCMNCHTDPGVNGAPPVDMNDYETTKEKASLIVQRIAAGQMPPPGAPPLPAEKYELVLRWYSSGQNP